MAYYNLQRRIKDWRTHSKFRGIVYFLSDTATILVTISFALSTGDLYTNGVMCGCKKNSSGFRYGENEGRYATSSS